MFDTVSCIAVRLGTCKPILGTRIKSHREGKQETSLTRRALGSDICVTSYLKNTTQQIFVSKFNPLICLLFWMIIGVIS